MQPNSFILFSFGGQVSWSINILKLTALEFGVHPNFDLCSNCIEASSFFGAYLKK